MPEAGAPPLPNISVRSKDSLEEGCIEWENASLELIGNAAPWRTFRWRHGQKHYSGTYWSATERAHVIYESRLELARLLFGNFGSAVNRIILQPFLIRANIDKRVRKHVPDYFLLTDDGPVVVDVKPSSQLDKPKVSSLSTGRGGWSKGVDGVTRCGANRRRPSSRPSAFWRDSAMQSVLTLNSLTR